MNHIQQVFECKIQDLVFTYYYQFVLDAKNHTLNAKLTNSCKEKIIVIKLKVIT